MLRFYLRTYLVPGVIILLLWVKFGPFLLKGLDEIGLVKRKGRIVFSSNRDGNWEIYTMNPDGFNIHRLTRTQDYDECSPLWSPDGKHIAFSSKTGDKSAIEVMSANGRKRRKLTDHAAKDTDPSWSPDGSKITFSSNRDGSAEILVMNADGSDVRKLTDHRTDDYCPRWQPDGHKILFLRKLPVKKLSFYVERIYSISPDGGVAFDVTDKLPCDGEMPSWSKDGNMMAFRGSLNVPNDQGVIYTSNNNGCASKQVTFRGEDEYDDHPTWSPDGSKIAFSRRVLYHRRPTDIYVIDIVTGEAVNITQGKGDSEGPDWF